MSHEEAQHQGMWANVSGWLGGENVETLVLVALCLGLWAVVGRRQALRRRHRHITRHSHGPAAAHSSAAGPTRAPAGAAASGQTPMQPPAHAGPPQAGASQAGPSPASHGEPLLLPATANAAAAAIPQNAVGLHAVAGLAAGSATSPAEVAGHAAPARADAAGPSRVTGDVQPQPADGGPFPTASTPDASSSGVQSASQSPVEAVASAAAAYLSPGHPAGGSNFTPEVSASAPDAGHANMPPASCVSREGRVSPGSFKSAKAGGGWALYRVCPCSSPKHRL